MAGLITDLTDGGALAGDEKVEVSKLSGSVAISGTTISVDDSDNSFNDSGSGFLSAGFAAGDQVNVEGFTNPANNLFFGVISSVTAAKMVIDTPEGDNLATEAAGDSVTISKWISARIDAAEFNLSAGMDIESDGTLVQLEATTINFKGAGVTVTDQGGYVVDVDIPGGGGGGGSGVDVESDGSLVQLDATILNFIGAVVTDQGGYQVDIDVSGGGGGAETITESGTSANLLNSNRGKYQRWTATGAKTLTVQPNATEAIDQDAEFYIANRASSDNLTIAAGSGVTINAPSGGGLVLEPGMAATLKRVAADDFDLIGQTTT